MMQATGQTVLDVVIVGAGPAGIGMALALKALAAARPDLPTLRLAVLESQRVGESFRRWPQQTRFVTPSFAAELTCDLAPDLSPHLSPHSVPSFPPDFSPNFPPTSRPHPAAGIADLNAVAGDGASPLLPLPAASHFGGVVHLSGRQYAAYLQALVQQHAVPVVSGCKVLQVQPLINPPASRGFCLLTEQGPMRCRFLIWATGEYPFPDLMPFEGAQHCLHTAQVLSWTDFLAPHYCVIGGGESAADAVINLLRLGRSVRLLVRQSLQQALSASAQPAALAQAAGGRTDNGCGLSPHTCAHLHKAARDGALEIVTGADVVRVSGNGRRGFCIHAADGRQWDAARAPILGTGFVRGGGARQIAALWAWGPDGYPLLRQNGESTLTPGLFLLGPQARLSGQEDGPRPCFIYQFRQQFRPVASAIATHLEQGTQEARREQEEDQKAGSKAGAGARQTSQVRTAHTAYTRPARLASVSFSPFP